MKARTCLVWIGDDEYTVTFEAHRGHPGSWYKRNGDPGDPPEDDELEITSILDENGVERSLFNNEQIERIWQQAWDAAYEQWQAEADDAACERAREKDYE
jgi:hypothetical protein